MHSRNKSRLVSLIIVIVFTVIVLANTIPCEKEEEVLAFETIEVETREVEVVAEEPKEEPKEPDYIRHDIPMPVEHQELLFKACQETGCPYSLALSVCWVETGMRNLHVGVYQSYMMINPRWVPDVMAEYGCTNLMNPYEGFLVGTAVLQRYITKYGTVNALTKYNTGHIGTSKYANKVLKYRQALFSEDN